ncbi:restriction endonuclease subunit S [Olleya sp.]|jgi:type I restriction enzyme S subunit|uniref:restriction endonuclease subunit S n=1 Tax=Olleya sp. TaxID=1906788 RepID=UPI0032D8FF25
MKKYESYKNSGIDWIGDIPKSWIVAKIGFFSDVYRGSGYQILNEVDEDYNGKKEKVLRIGDFNSYNPIWCEYKEQFENYRINKDDLLIGGTGHYFGKSLSVTEEMVGLIHSYNIIRLVINKLCSKYVFYWLSSPLIREQLDISVLGAGQPFIDIKGLKDLQILTPSLKEQTQIANYLDHKTHIIDGLIEKKEQLIKKLQAQRQAIINEAVTKGLNPNAKMKDSGIEWLGEIPEHWEVVKLKFIGDSITGITYSPNDVSEKGTLVLRSSNIQNGKLALNDTVYVNKTIAEKYITRKDDILLCSRNGSRNLIGKNIIIDERVENQSWGAFMTVYRSNYNDFMYYFFNSDIFSGLSSLFLSSTINQLTIGVINNMQIAFPKDESERKDIISFLKIQTKKLNKGIDLNKKLIKKLKLYRQSIISEAVTGKIDVRDWQEPSKNQ